MALAASGCAARAAPVATTRAPTPIPSTSPGAGSAGDGSAGARSAGSPAAGSATGTAGPVGAAPTAVSAAGPATGPAALRAAASAYLALAVPANGRLERDFDRFEGPDRGHLAASRADLRDIAATERAFDRGLARLTLPADAAGWARTLVRVNETRADLTVRVAADATSAALDAQRPALTAANVPVERAVTELRADLRLPPPDTH
ncbi:hypothetical protein [Streptacidiphilus sp. MAP12-33]|uniref:hypothetical protein n=1 Tax=Streptacidiphilus sp. MAP12-33 TaxID=3156266 RepID=UPI003516333F